MMGMMAKLGPGGRLVVPAAYRRALGVEVGDDLVLTLEAGELRITSLRRAVERAQARVRQHIPAGARLAEELLADRRGESSRE
jgi:bifunctional DNA-binding transcriptional regulator/antitoxin component of YhaV-PrlF toxin-antitoxin module